jgi:hypothetical protein
MEPMSAHPAAVSRFDTRAYPLSRLALISAALGAAVAAGLTANPHGSPDTLAYEALARNILSGHGIAYREPMMPRLDLVAFRSAGYGVFLASMLALGGVTAALAVQGALAGVTAALVGAIAARLAGWRAGVVAYVAAMAWPMSWLLAGQLLSETLYTLFVVLAVWLAIEAGVPGKSRAMGWAAAAGFAGTLALLTRGTGVAVLPAMALWVGRRSWRLALVLVAVALLAWAPWPIRNAQRLHAFVPILTSGGINAWADNLGRDDDEAWQIQSREQSRGEVGLDRMFWSETRDYARAHPLAVAVRAVKRLVMHIAPLGSGPAAWAYRLVWPLGVFAAFVALRQAEWRRALALPAMVWLFHLGLATMTVTNDRLRYPTDWVVIVAAACGVEILCRHFGTRRGAWVAAGIVAATWGAIEIVRASL